MNFPPPAEPAPQRRNGLRSTLAVLGGFFACAILSTIVDVALHAMGIFPPWGQTMSDGLFVLAAAYRVIFTLLAGYLTARWAPWRPMKHVFILSFIGLIAGCAGIVATWKKGPEFGPKWYPIVVAATSVPACWLGGMMYRPKVKIE